MKYSIITFCCLLLLDSCTQNPAAVAKPTDNNFTAPYNLAAVEKGGLATTIKLPAQLAAYEEVSIFPKVNGYVKTVLTDIGSKVSKGKLLMELEAPELQQAALEAREKYMRSRAAFSIDKEHYQRFLQASATPGAISPLDLSTLKAKMESDSALCNAEKVNWQMQQTMLGYLKVTAPFSGVITERNVHPGALVSAVSRDKPMLELKQVNQLRLLVDVPETIAGGLTEKDSITFFAGAMQGKKMTGTISRQSMNVNTQFRSERMEIDVSNPQGQLSPGMFVEVLVSTKGNSNAMVVPKSALVVSAERKYVLLVKNGKIIKITVTTGAETAAKIEVSGGVQPGDQVIINANDEIKEPV